jgi:hypothetical protein
VVTGPGRRHDAVSTRRSRESDRICSRNSAGAVTISAFIGWNVWVRIFTAERRAIRSARIMPT